MRVVHAPKSLRAAWVSDVHLGTRAARAASLLQFFREYHCETLYLLGDLIDGERLQRSFYWPQEHNDVIQKILRQARKGTCIIYIAGNHDAFVARFTGLYGNITVQKNAVHVRADGRRLLVIHGHELDAVVHNARWLACLGDAGYEFLLSLNPFINAVRQRLGLRYWSISAYAKQRVKNAAAFVREYERAVARFAEMHGHDSVVCGHIHSAGIHQIGNVEYFNCGDWVESCTALVEHHDGRMELVHSEPFVFEEARTYLREFEVVA